MKNTVQIMLILMVFLGINSIGFAAIPYQDFEENNGTPPAANSEIPEYGWTFDGVQARRTHADEPVHSGKYAWRAEFTSKEVLKGAIGVPSQSQTYQMNFFTECHDRLTFWIWSDSLEKKGHTVLVNFFDRNKYKEGIRVWTKDEAVDQQWTRLEIPFSALPNDFDLTQVDHIEFMHYWGGVYYYDDIMLGSSLSSEQEMQCYQEHYKAVCPKVGTTGECVTIYAPDKTELIFDYLYLNEN